MIRLSHCGCDPRYLDRQPRAWWMRVFFSRRGRYRCLVCHASMLLPRAPEE